METPSSTRRVTRSQAAAAAANSHRTEKSKHEEWHPRPRNGGDRAALLDITNDSPVVGLATGCFLVEKTPSSSAVKSRVIARRTPGSGEEVLRGQVRTLLQKVEEDTELVNKLPFGHPPPPPPQRFPSLLGLSRSPIHLLAPTPANTPQIPNMNCSKEGYTSTGFASPCVVPVEDDHPKVVAALNREEAHPQECLINRALMFDSPEKSDMSDISTISSSLTFQCSSQSSRQEASPDDDDNSIWSVQVHASANSDRDHHELLEEEEEEEEEEGIDSKVTEAAEEEEEEGEANDEELLGDLCEGMKKMSMLDDEPRLLEFTGKHTRFIYNSDDEMEGEEEAMGGAAVSPSVLVLKGLPAPQGKHLRFKEEDD
ncbi:unnamed protein product [Musa acuminata subsp. malaccensis]|uniref:(wild Malaysian banana) hypothetical protein n=1 Tax=Musa acuminata subsp. malaccensis TaxID=214687 RepID=A0A804I1Q1_MUSAM|nr:PREDICTED: uncharacterized protein LOC103975920 isoform X1 [Musa acuminata subsp. malaccensis]CAG1861768.1 unnamed protein product [Musa acuminata subsp. malaccensis]